MSAFQQHLFVCSNQRPAGHPRGCCEAGGGTAIRDALKQAIKERGLQSEIRANQAGCLDQCEWGPVIVIYPQGVWYGRVTLADVPRIVEETLVGGRIIEDLRIPDHYLNTPEGRAAGKKLSS
jgi:(2Fe-2S) ferredoxin